MLRLKLRYFATQVSACHFPKSSLDFARTYGGIALMHLLNTASAALQRGSPSTKHYGMGRSYCSRHRSRRSHRLGSFRVSFAGRSVHCSIIANLRLIQISNYHTFVTATSEPSLEGSTFPSPCRAHITTTLTTRTSHYILTTRCFSHRPSRRCAPNGLFVTKPRITIRCTGAAVVSFFAMENLSPPPGDRYRYPGLVLGRCSTWC